MRADALLTRPTAPRQPNRGAIQHSAVSERLALLVSQIHRTPTAELLERIEYLAGGLSRKHRDCELEVILERLVMLEAMVCVVLSREDIRQ